MAMTETKPFQKGDRVFDLRFGFGEVYALDTPENYYPVVVSFKGRGIQDGYTYEGAFASNEKRSLWHADLVELKEYVAGLKGE